MAKQGQDTNCPICGKLFYRFPSSIRNGRDFTCSRTCAARYFRDSGTTVPCEKCQTPFYRRKSLADRGLARFCSRKCEAASRPNQSVDCTCIQCGTAFKKDHWSVNILGNGGKFCTRQCADQFKRKLRKRGEQEMFAAWQKREWIGQKCERCGSVEHLELDHKHPRFAGGKAERENAQTLCRTCNRQKFWVDDYPLYRELLKLRAEGC